MARLPKKDPNVKKAQNLALNLVGKRRQLLSLRQVFIKKGYLKEAQQHQARLLIECINQLKKEIIDMGYNPKDAAAWAKLERQKKSKGKKFKEILPRGSGYGRYRLGNKIKFWN